jgi:hypothetical protein
MVIVGATPAIVKLFAPGTIPMLIDGAVPDKLKPPVSVGINFFGLADKNAAVKITEGTSGRTGLVPAA